MAKKWTLIKKLGILTKKELEEVANQDPEDEKEELEKETAKDAIKKWYPNESKTKTEQDENRGGIVAGHPCIEGIQKGSRKSW